MTLTDDLGRRVALAGVARRIVSLSPATTENLFAIGAGVRVVGRTSADNFPKTAVSLPSVGDFTRPSYEQLLALKPDLIIFDSATIDRGAVELLAGKARVPVFVQKSRTVADVARHLKQLGELTGELAAARRAARPIEDAVARPATRGKRPRVFVEVSFTPLYAAGPRSFVGDLLRLAGGENVVTGENPFPELTREFLLTANPQVYVVAGPPADARRTFPTPLGRIDAIRNRRVVAIEPDHLLRPTPRVLLGLDALRRALRFARL